ncbi:MAG TPA: DUF393 domain-containing protein [Caldithrix sp.]|nr:DUF393 domain-containing protein [Calditrichaceae bacterium]HEM49109.1 DUF393 domain-containing protein [Caldithrix sp.]
MKNGNKVTILFDGDCRLCNGSVRFIAKRDHKDRFTFIPLKSLDANDLITKYRMYLNEIDSVAVLINNKLLTHSTAVLTVARYLSGFWPLLYGLIIIPKFIRDFVYKYIARRRHKWFNVMK